MKYSDRFGRREMLRRVISRALVLFVVILVGGGCSERAKEEEVRRLLKTQGYEAAAKRAREEELLKSPGVLELLQCYEYANFLNLRDDLVKVRLNWGYDLDTVHVPATKALEEDFWGTELRIVEKTPSFSFTTAEELHLHFSLKNSFLTIPITGEIRLEATEKPGIGGVVMDALTGKTQYRRFWSESFELSGDSQTSFTDSLKLRRGRGLAGPPNYEIETVIEENPNVKTLAEKVVAIRKSEEAGFQFFTEYGELLVDHYFREIGSNGGAVYGEMIGGGFRAFDSTGRQLFTDLDIKSLSAPFAPGLSVVNTGEHGGILDYANEKLVSIPFIEDAIAVEMQPSGEFGPQYLIQRKGSWTAFNSAFSPISSPGEIVPGLGLVTEDHKIAQFYKYDEIELSGKVKRVEHLRLLECNFTFVECEGNTTAVLVSENNSFWRIADDDVRNFGDFRMYSKVAEIESFPIDSISDRLTTVIAGTRDIRFRTAFGSFRFLPRDGGGLLFYRTEEGVSVVEYKGVPHFSGRGGRMFLPGTLGGLIFSGKGNDVTNDKTLEKVEKVDYFDRSLFERTTKNLRYSESGWLLCRLSSGRYRLYYNMDPKLDEFERIREFGDFFEVTGNGMTVSVSKDDVLLGRQHTITARHEGELYSVDRRTGEIR